MYGKDRKEDLGLGLGLGLHRADAPGSWLLGGDRGTQVSRVVHEDLDEGSGEEEEEDKDKDSKWFPAYGIWPTYLRSRLDSRSRRASRDAHHIVHLAGCAIIAMCHCRCVAGQWPLAMRSQHQVPGHRGIGASDSCPSDRRLVARMSWVVGRRGTLDTGRRSTAMPSRHKDKAEEAEDRRSLLRAPVAGDAGCQTRCEQDVQNWVRWLTARSPVGKEGGREESCQKVNALPARHA